MAGLLEAVSQSLAERFSVVVVGGEISGFTRAASGHCYFGLKDADGQAASLRCAMFRRAAAMLDFAPGDGSLVELRGRVAVYEPRGELQFVVEAMRRAGAGTLYEQFLKLRARLAAEGLCSMKTPSGRCRRCPRRIGVVTSTAGAALHDVLTALARRAPQVEVVIYPAPCRARRRRRPWSMRCASPTNAPRWTCCCWCGAAARWRTCGPSTTSASCARWRHRGCRSSAASATRPT